MKGRCCRCKKGKGRRLNKPKRTAAFVFISPAVLFLVVFSVIPMLYSFGISFFHYNTSMNTDTIRFIGLKNYVSVLTNRQFLDSACWTFIFTISAVALNLLFGMTLAVVLDEFSPQAVESDEDCVYDTDDDCTDRHCHYLEADVFAYLRCAQWAAGFHGGLTGWSGCPL